MGEGLPFWLQRIDNRYLLEVKIGAVDKLPKLPSEYFLDNFVITTAGVTSMPALRLSLDVLGVERILFAADFPYEDDAEAVRPDLGNTRRRFTPQLLSLAGNPISASSVKILPRSPSPAAPLAGRSAATPLRLRRSRHSPSSGQISQGEAVVAPNSILGKRRG